MKFVFWAFILCLSAIQNFLSGQTFSFECVCDHISNDTCDICPKVPGLQSRSFHGLLIRRNGTPYKWIDEPYTVKKFSNGTIEFLELLPNPDKIIIARFQTAFSTMQGFADSTNCSCNLGGSMNGAIEVDTPIIGDGTTGSPITIGQFGADTTSFLNWKGDKWMPGKVQFSDIEFNLPTFANDSAAIAGGLSPGDAYLVDCGNSYSLPGGVFKVVKTCEWDCAADIRFFKSDLAAKIGGVPIGKEYAVSDSNTYGVTRGFVKAIFEPRAQCETVLPQYSNDATAIIGGLAIGDIYNVSVPNTYGAPVGTQRIVSNTGILTGDPPTCCEFDENLPFYANDEVAQIEGLPIGAYYYLSEANTLGFPRGTKKRREQ